MSLSVLHLSFSQSGGAGGVASILSQARADQGLPTSHWFSIERNLRTEPWSAPLHTVAAVVDDTLVRRPSFDAPISLARDRLSVKLDEKLSASDVLHLHSVNGVLDPAFLARRFPTKRIVWTLHDMNPMTGACHYSLGCEGYLSDCSSCPAVRKTFEHRVSASLSRKSVALKAISNLAVVSPSQWLATLARESSAFRDIPIDIIPNPIRSVFCEPLGNIEKTKEYTFCVIAQNLADPVKNIQSAIAAFVTLRKSHPDVSLALVGKNGEAFLEKGISVLGPLEATDIAHVMGKSKAVIVPSLAENSPLIIAEAAARGTPCIVRDVGGMPEMVTSLGRGHVFSSDRQLGELLSEMMERKDLDTDSFRHTLSRRALSYFSPVNVVRQYDDLYSV